MQQSGTNRFSSEVLSRLTAAAYDRKDYRLFSMIRVPEMQKVFVGVFGQWLPLPEAWFQRQITGANSGASQ